jgi:hypothetical protein
LRLINPFIPVFIKDEIKLSKTDDICLSFNKSILNYFRKYKREYFRSLIKTSITEYIKV